MKLLKKIWQIITELNWTVAGTILVLITLSGATKEQGIIIFAIATSLNIIDIIMQKDDSTEDS